MTMTCGQALVRLLKNYGTDTVFGIPGVHTLELYRGLPGSDVRHVLTRHEQGAGFMADGYARVTGKPGVCFVITGPGLTNAATPIGQAYADSIPMLVISSVNEVAHMGKGRGRLHETQDQQAISAPLTAFSATAYCQEDIPELLARAYAVFNSDRPRPVHIAIPMDVLAGEVSEDWSNDVRLPAQRPAPCLDDVEKASALLSDAKRPLIIAGGGALAATEELKQVAEFLGASVFTTVAGKGLLPIEHPLNAGSVLCVEPSWEFVSKADVILAVGTELADTDMWRDTLPLSGKLIRVDIDSRKMNDLYRADLPIVADGRQTLKALATVLSADDQATDISAMSAEVAQLKATITDSHEPLQQRHCAVLDVLQQTMPSDAFVSADMTQIAYTGNYAFASTATRSWLHPTGYGTLGYALPAAVGAKVGRDDRPGVVLVGDGGFMYTLQELATAVEEIKSPLVVLLWNNSSLGQIRDDMVSLDIPPVGVMPSNPDFIKLAEGFGCRTACPQSLSALRSELETAFAFNGVSFIEMQHDAAGRVNDLSA